MKDMDPVNTINATNKSETVGSDTVWHEHKTGDTIEESGHYFCTAGQHLDLIKGELFPVCPNTGEVTIWQHAE
jgi:hypothetical protein